ncbi:pollen-specific leucine-rich repeat extensin-like protein 1 [Benincasa hispida]|uniref:pollen-specific leucine-rich repeat extensin-like protein 1 n=1 Tax=Benincasa hispida TaxID=102211 RepID=UPI001901B46F|nr:pollen-specific leucine-rich repeat extensin-like protein 1 [Benincasa hispida]
MSNLPRFGRTWNRFSSLPRPVSAPRPEIQPLTTATEPEVPTTANVLQTSPIKERSPRIPSPVAKFPSPPSSPKYGVATTISPRKPLSPTPAYNRYDGERRTSATTSPKAFKPTPVSPPLSPPKPKHSTLAAIATAAPLSPLALPRSEVRREPEHTVRPRSPPEVEQKKVLYQTTMEKTTKTEHRQPEYISGKPNQKHQHNQQQQQLQSDVINIKGENVGAVMHITQSSDGSEIVKKKPNKENEEKANKSTPNFPAKQFMNSNFQGVNNSILYNSSLSHRDPGLHLAYSKKPNHGDSLHDSRH